MRHWHALRKFDCLQEDTSESKPEAQSKIPAPEKRYGLDDGQPLGKLLTVEVFYHKCLKMIISSLC